MVTKRQEHNSPSGDRAASLRSIAGRLRHRPFHDIHGRQATSFTTHALESAAAHWTIELAMRSSPTNVRHAARQKQAIFIMTVLNVRLRKGGGPVLPIQYVRRDGLYEPPRVL